MAFHSAFSKTKLKFKMWFLFSLSIKFWFQVLLGCGNVSRTQWNWMALELVSGQFEFLEYSRASLSVAKNSVFKEKKRRNRPINGRLAINYRDDVLFREALRLIDDRPIIDGGFICVHVTRRSVVSSHSFDLHLMVTINRKIIRSRLIVTVMTP